MDIAFALKGIVLGFSIAAPVGPIGVLCIRRTLAAGRGVGFVSGLGAATADTIYGAVAGFGLTAIANTLLAGQTWLRLAGGLFLAYLGVRTFLARPAAGARADAVRGFAAAYASTFALTLTNPMTILSFAAIFAGLGVTTGASYADAASLVAGVFAGSALWWFILSTAAGAVRTRLTPMALRWVNHGAGVIIAAFGLLAIVSGVLSR